MSRASRAERQLERLLFNGVPSRIRYIPLRDVKRDPVKKISTVYIYPEREEIIIVPYEEENKENKV